MKKKYFIILLLAVSNMGFLKAQPLNVTVTNQGAETSKEQKITFTGGPVLEMNVSNSKNNESCLFGGAKDILFLHGHRYIHSI